MNDDLNLDEFPGLRRSKRDSGNWIVAVCIVAGVLLIAVAVVFLADLGSEVREVPAVALTPVELEAEAEPASPPPLPTLDELRATWQSTQLVDTLYASLEMREVDGDYYLVFTAVANDSIENVVADYYAKLGLVSFTLQECVDAANRLHQNQYNRGLWPNDAILLLVPLDQSSEQDYNSEIDPHHRI